MKKLFIYLSVAVLGVAAASCQKELAVAEGGKGNVNITIQTPEVATKAIADGMNVDIVHYEIYKKEEGHKNSLTGTHLIKGTVPMSAKGASLTLNLLQGQEYVGLFWAQVNGQSYYDVTNLRDIKVAYPNEANSKTYANDEARAAFCQKKEFTTGRNVSVVLERPFAQINLGTTIADLNDDYEINLEQSSMTVKGVANSFNVAAMTAGETEVNVEFSYATLPYVFNPSETLVANNQTWAYAGMNYVLVPGDAATVDVTYSIKTDVGTVTRNVPVVPVQKNYRTNLLGNLLTQETAIEIVVDEKFNTPDLEADPLYMAAATGGEYTLTKDVVLSQPLNVQSTLELDLNNHTITVELEEEGRHFYAIENNAHLKLVGTGAINARGVKNFGTLVVDGDITITNIDTNGGAAIWNEGEVTINKGTFTTNSEAGEGSYGAALNTRAGGKATVNGGNFSAYSQLTYAIVNEGTTTINNATVKGKHGAVAGSANATSTKIYNGTFELMENPGVSDHCTYYCSEIYGGSFTLGKNTDSGAQVFYESTIAEGYQALEVNGVYYVVPANADNVVASAEALQAAINAAEAGETTIAFGADIVGDVTVVQKAGVKVTIDGLNKKYDGTIKVHSGSNHYADAALTIKNVNFEANKKYLDNDGNPYFNCIEALEKGSERYSTNITVDGCTFTAVGEANSIAVGLQIKSSKWARVINSTATDMHSLIQAQSCDETVVVNGCTINGKNGVAFKQVKAATVEGTTITAREYGIRFDGNTDNYGIVVKDNNVTAVQPFIVRKMTGKNNTIVLEGANTLTTDAPYQIVITNGSDDKPYAKPTGTYTLTGAENYVIYPDKEYCDNPIKDQDSQTYEGDVFEAGYMENALWINNYIFGDGAAIVVENTTYNAIVIENCSGKFDTDVITIKNNNSSVMILQNLDFTLAEGKMLIKSVNPYYQVFMENITINGEKMTQESIAEYLENVAWYQVVEEI